MTQITLFSGQSGDGNSNIFYKQNDEPLNIYISGDLGGGTLTLKAQTNGGEWVTNQSFTATGFSVLNSSTFIGRVTLSGSTSPSANVYVEGTDIRGG